MTQWVACRGEDRGLVYGGPFRFGAKFLHTNAAGPPRVAPARKVTRDDDGTTGEGATS